ncbi:hypothetical protein H6S82_01475 [Planktothrix sp. FACHB-1355]|uniref:hypothetical protein n=1 Tax=Planktothrix sp. FACHB-1355 TaxID=2692854 RepID=UPI00168AC920|nr:hypothetical protein [Planktothrix sp. FACHB-1355]MBD3557538.1 hypothetical protein [Planktothrix sp. FACHB-1355]MBD3885896.1 hypothetical protein [Phormidium tenue FACHB-886]
MKYKFILGAVSCIFFLVIIFPFEKTSIPEWRVLVVDRNDNPVPNLPLRQAWSHEKELNQETLITNNEGVVIFPERKSRQPLLIKIIFNLIGKFESFTMPHGSLRGPRASVFPATGARSNILHYSEGEKLEKKMVLIDYPYDKRLESKTY